MPKDKIEYAIRRASGQDAVNFEEIYYEGYAPHGIALLIESATDNPTRTVANIRSVFKQGRRQSRQRGKRRRSSVPADGRVPVPTEGIDADELELELIDHGLEEMLEGESDDGDPQFVLRCAFTDLGNVQRALEERGITPASAGTEYICLNPVPLSEDEERDVLETGRHARAGRGRPARVPLARLSLPVASPACPRIGPLRRGRCPASRAPRSPSARPTRRPSALDQGMVKNVILRAVAP